MSKILFLFSLPIILLLVSCTAIEEKPVDISQSLETGEFSAWRLSSDEQGLISSNRAVSQLLQQADDLIARVKYTQAGDKLERLVRIEPKFAQAWSRLAWLALKNNDAKRSRQLAQRSNSFSRKNTDLKILNWQFILKSGESLGRIDIVHQAEEMIKNLSNE